MNYPELLLYWIKERYAIFQRKEQGLPAPWSADPVFQTTYFCNVHRENDRVTRWIRTTYSPYVDHPLFEYNMVLARFLNRIKTLEEVGYRDIHRPSEVVKSLISAAQLGPIWGNAYVITTHGQKMDKLAYLAQVLNAVHDARSLILEACRTRPVPQCQTAANALQLIPGIGSFLAAQVVADLKNTINHPLYSASDRATFVLPGPGSVRGLGWFHYGDPTKGTVARFDGQFKSMQLMVYDRWPTGVPVADAQDLQNCLCEFDKYCRVKNGTGRSKRKYDGTTNRRG